MKPIQLIHTDNQPLRELLQSAEYAATLEEEEPQNGEYYLARNLDEALTLEGEEDVPSDEGSASASDDDDELNK